MQTITVFGSAQPQPSSTRYEEARELGQRLAEAGYAVVNGGYGGTMEGVSRGATEAGGTAIGITCAAFDDQRAGGNAYLTRSIHAPDLLARLLQLVELGDAYVVLDGGIGTLLELLLVWNLLAIGAVHKPCLLLGAHWRQVLEALSRQTQIGPQHTAMLHVVDTPAHAVRALQQALA
jgi:uncharacterized protein (TIGR00730 family)